MERIEQCADAQALAKDNPIPVNKTEYEEGSVFVVLQENGSLSHLVVKWKIVKKW